MQAVLRNLNRDTRELTVQHSLYHIVRALCTGQAAIVPVQRLRGVLSCSITQSRCPPGRGPALAGRRVAALVTSVIAPEIVASEQVLTVSPPETPVALRLLGVAAASVAGW